jgi:hypothetical protein
MGKSDVFHDDIAATEIAYEEDSVVMKDGDYVILQLFPEICLQDSK